MNKNINYDYVFILNTLPNFDNKENTGRTTEKHISMKLGKVIEQVYKKQKIKTFRVKVMSIKDRIKFIENKFRIKYQ